jgi:hypothetical protein
MSTWNEMFPKCRLDLVFANQNRLSVAPATAPIYRPRPSESVSRHRKDLFRQGRIVDSPGERQRPQPSQRAS